MVVRIRREYAAQVDVHQKPCVGGSREEQLSLKADNVTVTFSVRDDQGGADEGECLSV
jgi:hypothetical protein